MGSCDTFHNAGVYSSSWWWKYVSAVCKTLIIFYVLHSPFKCILHIHNWDKSSKTKQLESTPHVLYWPNMAFTGKHNLWDSLMSCEEGTAHTELQQLCEECRRKPVTTLEKAQCDQKHIPKSYVSIQVLFYLLGLSAQPNALELCSTWPEVSPPLWPRLKYLQNFWVDQRIHFLVLVKGTMDSWDYNKKTWEILYKREGEFYRYSQ